MGSVPCGFNWSQLIRKKKELELESNQREIRRVLDDSGRHSTWPEALHGLIGLKPGKVLSLRACQLKKP